MTNALDVFREQRVAAGQVYAVLRENAALLSELQTQVKALSSMDELKALLWQGAASLDEIPLTSASSRLTSLGETIDFSAMVPLSSKGIVTSVFSVAPGRT